MRKEKLIELIKYGFWGGISTAINLALFYMFIFFKMQYVCSNIVSYIIAVIFSYIFNDGSRKFGLSKATGEYICFVDCDDVLEKDAIAKMMYIAENEQNSDLIICDFQKFNNEGKILYKRKFKNEKKALIQSVAPWAKLYKKDFLERKELTFRNVPFGEDILFTTDLYLANPKVSLCHYIGYSWRENLQSTSHTELRGFPLETVKKAKEYFKYLDKKYLNCSQKLMYFKFKYFV